MSSSLPSPAPAAAQSVQPATRYAATRHAVWLGAAAIITDQIGRVLLVRPTYREDDRWLLPGGVVEPGEHPHLTCRREITEELGLDLDLSGVLAVHSLSPHHSAIKPGASLPFPGEIRYVFDGGTLTPGQAQAIRLPREELSEYAFLETREAVQRMRPVDGHGTGGMGLHLVEDLGARVFTEPLPGGKCVHADLTTTAVTGRSVG